jgi:hypothetical protein
MDAVGQLLTKGQNLLLVEGPSFDLLSEIKTVPKIPAEDLVEASRADRHRKWMTDDVQEMRVGKVLEDES